MKSITKIIRKIYMKFALKWGLFFCKVIVVIKMKIKGIIKKLKIKKN